MKEQKILEIERIEQALLMEAIYKQYGYDFRNYSKAHVRRRIKLHQSLKSLDSISALQGLVLHNEEAFNALLLDLSINVTEMFRDPEFYEALREYIIPNLKTYPYIKIWHAGCSSGEEVYSMQILLEEEGLLDRVQIYATDFNQMILEKAKAGLYEGNVLRIYEENYKRAGGKKKFSDYYDKEFHRFRMLKKYREKVVFADHNLVTDSVFSELHLIICRNVLIYFDRTLQNHVLNLFNDSLHYNGYLCLGAKENIRYTQSRLMFEPVSEQNRIYKKIL